MNPIKRLYLRLRYGWNSILANPEYANLYQNNTVPYTVRVVKNVTPKSDRPLCLRASVVQD
jgi:hypothetical protein